MPRKTVYILAHQVGNFWYYIHFPRIQYDTYHVYTKQGLQDNATHFANHVLAEKAGKKLSIATTIISHTKEAD